MLRRAARWIRSHKLRTCLLIALSLCAGVNILAYMHARSMTRFVTSGARTASPEQLGFASKLRVLLTGVAVPRPINHQTPTDLGLSFTTLHTISSDGIDLEMWHVPPNMSRTPRTLVLLFHAYASSKQMMLPAARALHDLGYDTLLVDFRGCGGSTGDETTIGYRESDDVIAATRFARERFSPDQLILFGDSMGATAVLRAASIDPTLADAIIVAAPFDRLLSTVENRFAAMKLPAFPFARLIVFWGGVRQGHWAFGHNPADYASKITRPVLHLHGERDPRVTLAQARNLFAHFAGPKQLMMFEGAGHSSHLEAHPRTWIIAVSDFINAAPTRISRNRD